MPSNLFDQFDDVEANPFDQFDEKKEKGFFRNVADLTKEGARSALTAARLSDDVATGNFDQNTPSLLSRELNIDQSGKPKEFKEVADSFAPSGKAWKDAGDFTDNPIDKLSALGKTIWNVGEQAVTNPKGLAYLTASQIANMAPSIAGMMAGAKTGAVVGAMTGPAAPVLSPTLGLAGGIAGGFAGEWPMEAGSEFVGIIGKELAARQLDPNEQNISKLLSDAKFMETAVSQARTKATTTAAIDSAFTMGAGRMVSAPGRAAEKVAAKELGAAASAAEIAARAKEIIGARTIVQKTGNIAKATGVDVAGGGLSEAGGQYNAYGEVDMADVGIEMLGELGGAGIEIPSAAWSASKGALIKKQKADAALNNITNPNTSTDESIQSFNASLDVPVPNIMPRDVAQGGLDISAISQRNQEAMFRESLAEQGQSRQSDINELEALINDETADVNLRREAMASLQQQRRAALDGAFRGDTLALPSPNDPTDVLRVDSAGAVVPETRQQRIEAERARIRAMYRPSGNVDERGLNAQPTEPLPVQQRQQPIEAPDGGLPVQAMQDGIAAGHAAIEQGGAQAPAQAAGDATVITEETYGNSTASPESRASARPITVELPHGTTVIPESASQNITLNKGKPFKTEAAAKLRLKQQKLDKTHKVTKVEGGFGIQEKPQRKPVVRKPVTVNTRNHTLLQAIAIKGVDPDDALANDLRRSLGIADGQNQRVSIPGSMPQWLFRKNGKKLDDIAGELSQGGERYLDAHDRQEMLDKLFDDPDFMTPEGRAAQAEREYAERQAEEQAGAKERMESTIAARDVEDVSTEAEWEWILENGRVMSEEEADNFNAAFAENQENENDQQRAAEAAASDDAGRTETNGAAGAQENPREESGFSLAGETEAEIAQREQAAATEQRDEVASQVAARRAADKAAEEQRQKDNATNGNAADAFSMTATEPVDRRKQNAIDKAKAKTELAGQTDLLSQSTQPEDVSKKDEKTDTSDAKKLEVLKAQARGDVTGDQADALKQLADAGEHAAVDEVLGGSNATSQPEAAPDKPVAPLTKLEAHKDLFDRATDGKVTSYEFKAAYAALLSNKEAITDELDGLTKAKLFERYPGLEYRYKNEKKADVVSAAYRSMTDDFTLGESYSYGMSSGSRADAIQAIVDRTTDQTLADYTDSIKAAAKERAEQRAEIEAGLDNPKELDDFSRLIAQRAREMEGPVTFQQARMTMTPKQREQFDILAAEKSRGERASRKDTDRSQVQVAGATTGAEIIATKHTRDGYYLFVVKAAERVERDVYSTWLATAKSLGGWYSAFRGNGAIPGFQFKTRESAEAFQKYVSAGDTQAVQDQTKASRDAYADDRSQTAIERLTEMADRLEEKAEASLGHERKANTARRARFAASAEAAASAEKAMAKTMRNLANAIKDGKAKFLDRIRQKTQVEMLAGMIKTAHNDELRVKYPAYVDYERHQGEPATAETVDYVTFPGYTAFRSDLASLGRALLEMDGTKKLGQRMMKVADDVSDAYMKFAKDNIDQVSGFRTKDGARAAFPSKAMAEAAIARSGYKGAAIVLPVKRNENHIIFSPSEAIKRGVWPGDNDTRITLTREFGDDLVAAIGKVARRGAKVSVPWQFESAHDKRARLSAMGIETPAELRAALREFIALKENTEAPSKIKELERAMIGRQKDGLDFFPTPVKIADEMVETAGIKPGMTVLEPSAGMGHIAERIREAGVEPDVVELANNRKELLEAKGFNVVGRDFMDMKPREFFTYGDTFKDKDGNEGVMRGLGGMGSNRVRLVINGDERTALYVDRDDLTGVRKNGGESGYDRILMNPPFGDRRDAEHVQHAYELLRPGGRVVAIMGEGVFFGGDKKAQAFRDWLEQHGGTDEKLDEGTFLDAGLPVNTGVNARMVVVDKPGELLAPVVDETDQGAAKFSRRATPATGIAEQSLRATFTRKFPQLSKALDAMLKRGNEGKKGGVVLIQQGEDVAQVFADKTGVSLDDARKSLQMSVAQTSTQSFKDWFGDSAVVDAEGKPLVVYHGTAYNFNDFDSGRNRTELNDKYQGDGFHFSEDPQVASRYADANRNRLLRKQDIYPLVEKRFPGRISQLFRNVVEQGYEKAWDVSDTEISAIMQAGRDANVDLNDLLDIAEVVEGSKYHAGRENANDPGAVFAALFGGSGGGLLSEYHIDDMVKMGIDAAAPAQNVVPVYLKAENVLRTSSRKAAQSARKNGYDAVYYTGDDLVGGVPEWVVFNPNQIKSAIGNNGEFYPKNPDIRYSQDGQIQAFFDPASGITFMVAENIDADTAANVLLHEAVHGNQRDNVDAAGVRLLTKARKIAGGKLREVLDEAANRMVAAGAAQWGDGDYVAAPPSVVFGKHVAPLAIRAYNSLSDDARRIVDGWNTNWHLGQDRMLESEGAIEIRAAYAPVRNKLREIYGNTVPAYRGEYGEGSSSGTDRTLFSWTPIKDIAVSFGINARRMPPEITQSQVDKAVDDYKRNGIVKFNGIKYLRSSAEGMGDDYFLMYRGHEIITDGEDIASTLQAERGEREDYREKLRSSGKVYSADVPVDSIFFVPVGANLTQPEFVSSYNPRSMPATEVRMSRSSPKNKTPNRNLIITDEKEAAAYIVEVVAGRAREAGFSAVDGKFMDFVDSMSKTLGKFIRDFVASIRASMLRYGVALKNPTVDDLVAYAEASMKRAADGDVMADNNGITNFSSAGKSILHAAWKMLAGDMSLYKHAMPDSFDMEGAAREIDPGMRAAEDKPDIDEEKTGIVKKWYVSMADKTHAYVYENKDGEVWLDASRLDEGVSGGTKLYLLVGSYAEGNGKVFIGDPAGLSDVALIRRTDNMLSLALRFGSTRFIEPHEFQMNPEAKFDTVLDGIARPITWVKGDDENNLTELLKTSAANINKLVPEIKEVAYNFETGRFERQDGTEFTNEDFESLRKQSVGELRKRGLSKIITTRNPGRSGGAVEDFTPFGSATLKRTAVTNTLSRAARGGTGRELLDRISQLVPGELKHTPLRKILYSRKGTLNKQAQIPGTSTTHAQPIQNQRNLDLNGGSNGHAASWDSPEPSRLDRLIYTLQDKNIDLKRVSQAIKSTGKDIADSVNAYLQEELYHGRTATRTKDFVRNELDPLINEMRMRGVAMADFEEYLWMRHAEERNTQIAKVNPEMEDGGSGIATQDAIDYLESLPADKRKAYESLAKKVDAINKATRQTWVSYGIESQDTVTAMESAYQHYVPLMREDMDHSFGNGTGQGFSVKGNSSKRATGSNRAVVDILANMAQAREKAIIRGEKNRVSKALIGLAMLNPNSEFWKIDKPPTVRTVNERTGLVEDRIDPSYKNRDNVIVARAPDASGKIVEHSVIFNERDERAMRMAASLKNLDQDQISEVLSAASGITRYFASINTQYNPIFGVINLTRDVQGAMLNLSSTPLAGKQKAVLGHTLSALRGIYADIRDHRKGKTPSSQWAQLWEEFQKEGGQTGYRDMFKNAKDRAEALEQGLNPDWWQTTKWGKVLTVGGALNLPEKVLADKAIKPMFEWLTDYNETMENSVRLAAYKVAKESGMSNQQAASLAKNLTVNFNRKGEIGRQVGSLYAFFNASVQGTARLAETLKGPAGKRIVMGGILLGAMQAMMLAMAGMDDDEPPEFVRDRAIIIPTGDGKYISIPMPLGFNVLPNFGRIMTEFVLSGFKEPQKRIVHLLDVVADSFNPIGNAGISMQTIAPTVLDPMAALAENKDWTGKPIARNDFNSLNPTPGFTRAKDTASVLSKAIAEGMNWMTGGTDYKPGAFSPSPDQIDYLIGQLTGGVGREYLKAEQTVTSLFSGEELPTHKIPLVGRFYGDTTGQSSQGSAFYSNLKEINSHEAEINGRRKNREDVAGYIRDNPESRLVIMANHAEREVGKLRKQKRMLIENDASPERIKLIEQRITATMKRLNDRVRASKEAA